LRGSLPLSSEWSKWWTFMQRSESIQVHSMSMYQEPGMMRVLVESLQWHDAKQGFTPSPSTFMLIGLGSATAQSGCSADRVCTRGFL
jgi:hypothetical protein